MNEKDFNKEDFWRAIILYGRNEATYKIALGQCLISFANIGKNFVSMSELASEFFDLYHERLRSGKPQLAMPNRRTVMERIVDLYNLGLITKNEAKEKVEMEAFNDVIPRFHNVNSSSVPVKFYEQTSKGLVLSDNLFEVFTGNDKENLIFETLSRWDLLEAAFEIKRNNNVLENDIRRFYLAKGYERTEITDTIPVLNGYQNGICFYCGERMNFEDIHVDHVIPRQLIFHDHIWNLVLAHGICNMQKSDSLPHREYIDKLLLRNEHFIISNHPIKERLIKQLGQTHRFRSSFVNRVYEDAKIVLGNNPWIAPGYKHGIDNFYKTFISRMVI